MTAMDEVGTCCQERSDDTRKSVMREVEIGGKHFMLLFDGLDNILALMSPGSMDNRVENNNTLLTAGMGTLR
jgi:hypothetical protein